MGRRNRERSWRAGTDARIWALVAALAAAAATLHGALLSGLGQVGEAPHAPWLLLVLGFALAERWVVYLHSGREVVSVSLAELVLVLALFVSTPTEAVSAAVVGGAVVLAFHGRQPPQKLAFNMAHTWLAAVLAVLLWRMLLGGADPHSLQGSAAAVVAALSAEMVSSMVVAAVIALRDGQRFRRPVALRTSLLTVCASAAFALVVVDVLRVDWRGGWAVLLVAAFLALAQRAHLTLVRRHDALEALEAFTSRIGGGNLHLQAVVEQVLHGIREALSADTVTVHLAAHEAGEPAATWRCDEGVVRRLDVTQEPGPASTPVLTAQLPASSGVTGSITVTDRRGGRGGLSTHDRALLVALTAHAAMALHNGRLTDRLRSQVVTSARQALRDPLTDLPNRLAFDGAASSALATGRPYAVLLMDLDRFKDVNDTLGHAAGDAVLREAAKRVERLLGGRAEPARLGGDEFAVLLPDGDRRQAYAVAAEMRAALLAPLEVEGLQLTVDASIGIALSPEHGTDTATLMRHADIAMYAAKEAQLGVGVYDPLRDRHTADRLSLITDLRGGIDRGELTLVYQPQTATTGRAVTGVEALVRWQHPVRGTVPPGEFIDVAERTGLIGPLTEWVVRAALAQCRRWLDMGLHLGVAVNISPRSLEDPLFVGWLGAQLVAADVPPALITVEITESGLMRDPDRAIAVLHELRGLGVRLSLDDLGVGHSSLAHLKQLPLDEVKIDRSFVTGVTGAGDDAAIVETLVRLGEHLGLTVVAEGVEDEETFELLSRLGSVVAQGYWMSRPLPPADVPGWVRQWCAPAVQQRRAALA